LQCYDTVAGHQEGYLALKNPTPKVFCAQDKTPLIFLSALNWQQSLATGDSLQRSATENQPLLKSRRRLSMIHCTAELEIAVKLSTVLLALEASGDTAQLLMSRKCCSNERRS